MSHSGATQWTNKTLEALQGHAAARGIPHRLCADTKKHGARFLTRQTKPTEGVRHVRLYAWYYIRRLQVGEIMAILTEHEQELRPAIRKAMEEQALYHVVVEGNDPRFVPPGDFSVTSVVTTYFCENFQGFKDEIDKYLFDELDDPSAIRAIMDTPSFCDMLEDFWKSGDTQRQQNGHLVARLGGSYNLLHSCIMKGQVETLRLLLHRYTWDTQSDTPWRVLAEPLAAVGTHRLSAFHRAVEENQASCLEVLIEWASRHGHDIRELKNTQLRSGTLEPELELTCLELAKRNGNRECYNILAPVFGKNLVKGVKEVSPEVTEEDPRVEIYSIVQRYANTDVVKILRREKIIVQTWADVVTTTQRALGHEAVSTHMKDSTADLCIKICNVCFKDDANSDMADALLAATAGFAKLKTEQCIFMTDRTPLAFLHALCCRLGGVEVCQWPTENILANGCTPVSGAIDLDKFGVPIQLGIASRVAENLEPLQEGVCDNHAAVLLNKIVKQMGYRTDFSGMPDGVVSSTQLARLSQLSGSDGWAAAWATRHASKIVCFIAHEPESDKFMEEWLRQRELVPTVQAVYNVFFSISTLLHNEWVDPKKAIDIRVTKFLELTLEAWFVLARDEDDAWHQWAQRLGTSDDVVVNQLAPALDIFLETLLRMENVLDFAFKQVGNKSIASLVRSAVPNALWGRLPRAKERLPQEAASTKKVGGGKSLTALCSASSPMRPEWAAARR